MLQYIIRRLIFVIPVAVLVCVMAFLTIYLVPGDPARTILGQEATEETVQALRHDLGLDQPFPVQLGNWLWKVVHGDFGTSYSKQEPVLTIISERLPVTLELGVTALLISTCVSIPLGVLAATRRDTWIDYILNIFTLIAAAMPSFVVGLVFIFFFAVQLRLLPPGGFVPFAKNPSKNLIDLILPAVTLALSTIASKMRQVRASMIEALNQDYTRTARSKGLRDGPIYFKHALRNAIIPVITIIGFQIGAILSGAFVIENIFLWPGIGREAVGSIQSKDYPLIQGIVLFAALAYMLANILIDIAYAWIDPRISFHKRRAR